jgi:multidrug resistance protein, MATE family
MRTLPSDRAALRPPLWRRETLYLARSGTTLAFNQLLQLAIPFVTTAMTGRISVEALAAGSVVSSIGLLLFVTALGVMQGLVPVVGISLGTGDHAAAARTIRGGLVAAIAMGLGATLIMACVPWALALSGQDAALVEVAERYVRALLPGYLLPSIVSIALRFFLIAVHDLRWLNPVIIIGAAFNLGCNLLLAGGRFGLDGMTAIGLTISLTNWLMFALLVAAMARSRRVPKGILALRPGLALRDALKLGIPVGAIFFTETLLFTGSSVLMGYFGKVPLAAHGIVTLWLNIALMVPIGISQAAMARVASLLGERDFAAVRSAMVVALIAGSTVSIVTGGMLVLASDSLVRLTLWSRSDAGAGVVEVARGFFRFCAITQLFSGLIIVMASILRGLRDANAVLWLVMLCYWGFGLGGAVLFGFALGFGGTGIWIGITSAFAVAALLLATRFRRVLSRPAG